MFLRYSLHVCGIRKLLSLNMFSQDGCTLLLGCRYRQLCSRYIYECKWGIIFTWNVIFFSCFIIFMFFFMIGQLVLCGCCVWCVLLLKTHRRCAEDQTFVVDFTVDFFVIYIYISQSHPCLFVCIPHCMIFFHYITVFVNFFFRLNNTENVWFLNKYLYKIHIFFVTIILYWSSFYI